MNSLKKFSEFIRNPEVDVQIRVFSMITAIGVIGVFFAFLGDIFLGENIVEIVVLGITVFITPFITVFAIRFNRLTVGTILIALLITFGVLPVAFFFGGGVYGGAVIWVAFCYLYIGLSLKGTIRSVMLTVLTVSVIVEYRLAYDYPGTVHQHTTYQFFVDSAISVLIIGLVTYITLAFQNMLFSDENKRARNQADKVENLNRSQNRFFSNMSHEIRTPINTILGLNEIILRQNDISEEVIRDSKSIEGAGKMLLSIINDILDMSKLESGNMDIVPVSYCISDMLTELVNMVWARAEAKGLRFKIDVDPSTPVELFGDEVRIKQILINLLTNAIKYTKEGLVKLYVESEPMGDNEIILTFAVSDTGMGIKKEAIPHLFDAFRRMDEEKNRNIEGTGLGLSIVKQLIDLMGGEITVNSVYTQGSTFVAKLRQSIVNPQPVGNIIIGTRSNAGSRSSYKQSFEAPETSVLIVDDNELNLKVEKKLLADTKINVETALSGEEALRMTILKRYDVILMDHLMPEMNGIECLALMRSQPGGLNRTTPVIALTANAGSQNQELYRTSGFDGYLCKPVSGDQLETMLLAHLPKDKVLRTDEEAHDETVVETEMFVRKAPIAITTSSMCDLPAYTLRNLNIGVIPYKVCTDKGVFLDEREIEAGEVTRYIERSGKTARTQSPEIVDLELFFANQLNKARYVIHITTAGNTLREYVRSVQAARAFGNVTVIDSGRLSSSMGIMVLAAHRMVQQNYDVPQIVEELEKLKKRLPCTYLVGSTEFMSNAGHISRNFHIMAQSFMMHPMIWLKDGRMEAGRIYIGSLRRAWRKYIEYILPRNNQDIDRDIIFVTYVGLTVDDLNWIEEQIRKRIEPGRIIFQQASATTAVNCGPGTFGILYLKSGDRSYNLGSMLPDEVAQYAEYSDDIRDLRDKEEESKAANDITPEMFNPVRPLVTDKGQSQPKWYDRLDGINGNDGIRNCGSEDAYKQVLEIFYDSIDEKAEEIEAFYEKGDFAAYTIKVHALKSSARIIGATDLGDKAQKLENAGKEGNEAYIRNNHEAFMAEYKGLGSALKGILDIKENDAGNEGKTQADVYLIDGVYDAIREAAEAMDIDAIETALDEIRGYVLPKDVETAFNRIRNMAAVFDYDGIFVLAKEKGGI